MFYSGFNVQGLWLQFGTIGVDFSFKSVLHDIFLNRIIKNQRINLSDFISYLNHKVCNYNLAQLLDTLSFKSLSTQKAWHVFGPIALLCFRCHSRAPL